MAERRRLVRLLRTTSPGLFVALLLDTIAMGVMPNVLLVTLGIAVGRVPAAVGAGLGSAEGQRLVQSMVLVVVAFLAAMLVVPVHVTLGRITKVRLAGALQRRLMDGVSRPAQVSHLDDPASLEQIDLARGTLLGWAPSEAPGLLAQVWSNRLTDLFAYAVLSAYVWWLGPALLVAWTATRRPIAAVIRTHIGALGGSSGLMRRAEYFRSLATGSSAAKELRVFALGDWVIDRFRSQWLRGMAGVWSIRSGAYPVIWRVGAVLTVIYVGATAYVAHSAWQGALDLEAVAVVLPVLAMTRTTGAFDFDDMALEWTLAALPHLEAVEDRAMGASPSGPGSAGRQQPEPPSTEIRFEGVRFAYPHGDSGLVFDGLDLSFQVGRCTAVVGANGAGKTTLVKLLTGLHEPTAGRITADGLDLADMDASAWQRHFAVVFQDFLRLPLSAAENIAIGAVEHSADRAGIIRAAESAGIRSAIEALPHGWATPLSSGFSGGTDLSSGQWQRVALARSMFAAEHGASILVLDEPTAWMDVRGESEFYENFLDLTRGLTTLIISHRFSTVRLADRICVLADGRLIEQGTHEELIASEGTYARMFRLQAARFAHSGGGGGS